MRSNLLFPTVFKKIGFVLTSLGLILGYIIYQDQVIAFLDYGTGNLTDEVSITLLVAGLIFIGFSKSEHESERVKKLRLNALYWSVLMDFLLISILWLIQYQEEILDGPVILFKNPFTKVYNYNFVLLLLIFLARFYYLLPSYKKSRKGRQLPMLPNKPYNLLGKLGFVIYLIIFTASATFKINNKYYALFLLFLPGILFWIWSKEKNEIGIVAKLRLKSMQIAVYINYGLFLIATWTFYGLNYLFIMAAGMISTPLIFLAVFYYQLFKLKMKHTGMATTGVR